MRLKVGDQVVRARIPTHRDYSIPLGSKGTVVEVYDDRYREDMVRVLFPGLEWKDPEIGTRLPTAKTTGILIHSKYLDKQDAQS